MSLRCYSPDLALQTDGLKLGEAAFDLQITLQRGLTQAEQLINGDGPVIEPAYLRQKSCLEPIGRYHIFQEERIQAGLRHTLMTYVFHADDGAVVGIEDAGELMDNYQFCRKIGKFIQLRYSLSKEYGDDFIEVDAQMTRFVKDLLIRVWEVDSEID
ncbi:hypothetical protein [Lacisediminimonas sp.]|uniref:hypothetical protein n=1 Tax=Lacisediminimonas sp. TaxID=3060582 RepID=UPI002726451A|nr:hypothetical protein [Lacisediminimonas sp.]MDO8300297.1 hypothetical protein [Lacisediminimonas sp.]